MSGHPLPGHRYSQTTTNFSDPDLQEREGLLRNAAPDLAAVLIEYERIEADMILDDECWDAFADLVPRYQDRLIELGHKRNAALEKAGLSFGARAKSERGEA